MALLKEDNGTGTRRLEIKDSRLVMRAADGAEGAEMRVAKNPQTGEEKEVWEYRFGGCVGMLVGAELRKLKFNDMLCLKLRDDEGVFEVQLKASTAGGGIPRATEGVMKMLPNIDVSEELTIRVFEDDKKHTAVLLKQDSGYLKHYYSRNEKHGMPEAKQKTVRGEKKWDFTEVENFLWIATEKWIADNFGESVTRPEKSNDDDYSDGENEHHEKHMADADDGLDDLF